MKNILIILGVVLVALAGWYFFMKEDAPETAQNETELAVEGNEITFSSRPTESVATMETGTYEAVTEDSNIEWEAGKPAISGYVHTGTFSLQSGEVTLTDGELTGEFVVDINSLKITSLGGGKMGQESTLEGHLKGEGFFDAENYSTATFSVTDVTPKVLPGPDQSEYTATGELTMKGKTESVSFPMRVIVDDNNEVWMLADVTLDRTKWGVSGGSASIADRITDNIIGDEVKLELEVKLSK